MSVVNISNDINIRRPNYSNQPKNIRKIIYDNNGVISDNER
jgi:hypothetical protein